MAKYELAELDTLVEQKLLSRQEHPEVPLLIYNYTPQCAFGGQWQPLTLAARGLILDALTGEVRARPFEKFFNVGEVFVPKPLPDEPFDVYEKLDGSLGITYWIDGEPRIATRGSFCSQQAYAANAMLRNEYAAVVDQLRPELTYLWEIIVPWNRIVVDYGAAEKLVLLAVIDTASGQEIDREDWPAGFEWVATHNRPDDIMALFEQEEPNREGFVVRFASGLRVKIKFEEYRRLHRLVTSVTPRRIWEMLAEDSAVESFPCWYNASDEFRTWALNIQTGLRESFEEIDTYCRRVFEGCPDGDRKTIAQYFTRHSYSAALFCMLDERPYSEVIWKTLKPAAARAFKVVDLE